MDQGTPKELFQESLNRCAESEEFIRSFYDRFLSASEDVREKFEHTDFDIQNQMLLRSLRITAGATAGDPDALRELRARAQTHDRYHLDIEPRLYEIWRTALIATASEFDSEWSDDIEHAWDNILGHVIHYMTKFY